MQQGGCLLLLKSWVGSNSEDKLSTGIANELTEPHHAYTISLSAMAGLCTLMYKANTWHSPAGKEDRQLLLVGFDCWSKIIQRTFWFMTVIPNSPLIPQLCHTSVRAAHTVSGNGGEGSHNQVLPLLSHFSHKLSLLKLICSLSP